MHAKSDDARSAEVLLDSSSPQRSCTASLSQIIAALFFISVGVLVGIAMLNYGVSNVMRIIINMLPESPSLSWHVFMCLATMLSIVVIMPIWPPMCMLNGLVFGFVVGSALNFFAIFGAATISLVLGRSFCRNAIRSCIFDGDYPKFKRILLILEDSENTIKFLLLFRFLFIPMFIRNYGPSILEVPLWKILISVIPHGIWVALLFASLGSALQDTAEVLRDGQELSAKAIKWQQSLIVCVGILFTVALTYYAHCKYTEKLEEESAAPLSTQIEREVAAKAQA